MERPKREKGDINNGDYLRGQTLGFNSACDKWYKWIDEAPMEEIIVRGILKQTGGEVSELVVKNYPPTGVKEIAKSIRSLLKGTHNDR